MNLECLEEPRWRWAPVLAGGGALILAGGLFLLIPISRMANQPPPQILETRYVKVVAPIPPKAPPPPPLETQAAPEKAVPPRMKRTLTELKLAQLDLNLQPGTGDALSMGIRMDGFAMQSDVVGDLEKIFDFSELPQVPSLIFIPEIQFPRDLIRRGIKNGKVDLLIVIDEEGKPVVESIQSSSHPSLEAVARRFAERARFSVNKVKGEAVKVRGQWPLILQAPR